jgi:phage I-like protein
VIYAFRAPSLTAAKEPPTRLKVANWGRNEALPLDKTPIVNETTVACLPHNQRLANFDKVALDFQHNTLPGTEAYQADKEPRKISAMGVPEVIAGDGLYLKDLEWTPEGVAAFTGGHFPDLSPAAKMNDAGEIIFLHSAALCRQGSITGLHAFSADKLPAMKSNPSESTPSMDYKKILCLMLGLDPTKATDADIETAATKFASCDDDAPTAEAAVKPVAEKVTAMSADLTKVTERLDGIERQNLTAQAIALGKIVPMGVEKLPLAEFKTMIASLPPDQVPLEKRTPEGVQAFSASSNVIGANSVEEEVRKGMGLSPEAWKKHTA